MDQRFDIPGSIDTYKLRLLKHHTKWSRYDNDVWDLNGILLLQTAAEYGVACC
jgi:hypothetical protein